MASGPDEGFAWVIALACFAINFIMAGLARSAGVLYVAIIDLFGVSREAATTPFSIRVCVRNMTGPLIGLLGQKYGVRWVTAVGGLVAGLGGILCYFAPNVLWITILWGVIHGLGFGLSTVIHMIAINQYFDKYKASALGLGYSGDCFGTFAFPVLMEHLFATYGVRGSFLIVGGIVLNVVPMALLLRKPPWIKKAKERKISKKNKKYLMSKNHSNNLILDRADVKAHVNSLSLSRNMNDNELKDNDNCTLYENISVPQDLSVFSCDFRGQFNKAFVSPEDDLNVPNTGGNSESIRESKYRNSLDNIEREKTSSITSQAHSLPPCVSEALHNLKNHPCYSNLRDCDSSLKNSGFVHFAPKTNPTLEEDLNKKNESLCNVNGSFRSRKLHVDSWDKKESLHPVLEKENSLSDDNQQVNSEEGKERDVKIESAIMNENTQAEGAGTLKKRTSSFIGVAHDFVERMRTASFASQVAQDAFVATITQESDSESEQEDDCQLKGIVEHKDHDIMDCTNKDLILSIDKKMMDDYSQKIPEKRDSVLEDKPKSPSIMKVLIKTNLKPIFNLISVTMAAYGYCFVTLLTIIIDYASDLGVSEERGKFLVIGFSVADLFGRLTFGQVIDRKLMKMKNYAGSTMLIMGVLVAAIPLNTSYNYIMVCMSMYGFIQGGTAIMFPILVNMYMEKNQESIAMGCLNFYGGILMLFMAPMIGFFRDKTGSYDSIFYIIGGVVAVVGIIWQFEPMIIKFQNRKLREKYIMREMHAINTRT